MPEHHWCVPKIKKFVLSKDILYTLDKKGISDWGDIDMKGRAQAFIFGGLLVPSNTCLSKITFTN